MDYDTRAALNFYNKVRTFALRVKPWQVALWHETLPDEQWDLTLVSKRVYGRRDEVIVVLAASGLSNQDQPLPVGVRLAFPTETQLFQFKRETGFESRYEHRDRDKPVWL